MSVRLRNLFFVSSLILGSAILSAQVPKGREVHADLSRVAGPHSQIPMRVVGAGRAEEGLRADWQEQLATVQREIGFHYLRMHGLLNDEMGVIYGRPAGPSANQFSVRGLAVRCAAEDAYPTVCRTNVYAQQTGQWNVDGLLVEG